MNDKWLFYNDGKGWVDIEMTLEDVMQLKERCDRYRLAYERIVDKALSNMEKAELLQDKLDKLKQESL
jgi:hypothetical protein